MELISINENKLKVIMSENDMREYGLDENEFYLSITNTRAILSKILQNARVHTGFENLNSSDKILIQLFPETHGGCELFITRITIDNSPFNEEEIFMSQGDERYLLPRHAQKQTEHKKSAITYGFYQVEHLIAACKELSKQGFSGNSSIYRYIDGKYFLVLDNAESTILRCLSEFGELENTENSILKALERGNCIFKQNAVALLSEI